jgi:glucose/arabinose dehydrogenase
MKLPVHALAALLAFSGTTGLAEAEKPAEAAASIGRYPLDVNPQDYISRIALPPGFSISIYRDQVPGARSLALSNEGVLYVGTLTDRDRQRIGKVYAVTNPEGDATGNEVLTIAEGLNVPNGVAHRDGSLYVAEINRILRYDDIDENLQKPPEPVTINDGFPDEFHHGWKYLRFGPDGRLYVPVGAPCNICEPGEGQGVIISLRADGSDKQVFARGVRNSVGFDWDPATGELWFTDNSRDLLGDDIPPDELNHAPRPGLHFGFPYRYGKDLVDASFTTDRAASAFTPAAIEFPAHNAPLGMRFYTGKQFPREYQGDLFVAAHGSWNREVPDGYAVFRVRMENGKAVDYEPFATGWLIDNKEYWGRPVDVEQLPDGSLLLSDDFNGLIYRISYDL